MSHFSKIANLMLSVQLHLLVSNILKIDLTVVLFLWHCERHELEFKLKFLSFIIMSLNYNNGVNLFLISQTVFIVLMILQIGSAIMNSKCAMKRNQNSQTTVASWIFKRGRNSALIGAYSSSIKSLSSLPYSQCIVLMRKMPL